MDGKVTERQDSKSKVAIQPTGVSFPLQREVNNNMVSERDIIIIRGLVLQGYDNEGILNFINGEKKTVDDNVDLNDKKPQEIVDPSKKQEWKNQLGAACREIENARTRDELVEVNRRYSRTFGKSDVYKRVLEEACRKFPSAQRYG